MKSKTAAASAAATLGLILSGATSSVAQAQPAGEEVAHCVRGEWESTGVAVTHPGAEDVTFTGGDGVLLRVTDNGAMTANFNEMRRLTFSGEKGDMAVRGYVELRGQGTGTITTIEQDRDTGSLEASNLDVEDVELTVALTEPFDSRPIDRVPVDELQRLMEESHDGESKRAETRYECGDDTLTVTKRAEGQRHHGDRPDAEVTWMFERVDD